MRPTTSRVIAKNKIATLFKMAETGSGATGRAFQVKKFSQTYEHNEKCTSERKTIRAFDDRSTNHYI